MDLPGLLTRASAQRRLSQAGFRNGALYLASVLAVFYFQPAMPIRQLDFWLPLASLALVVLVWVATCSALTQDTARDAGVLVGVVLAVSLTRYVEPLSTVLTRSRPPDLALVLAALGACAVLAGLTWLGRRAQRSLVLGIAAAGLLSLLIALKLEPSAQALSAGLRSLQGQSTAQASALDVRWLGFSYLAFRLLHVLRERALGKLPALSLSEFITYAVFAPALIAGPIDRAERFVKDLRSDFRFNRVDLVEGGRRVVLGLFKKFALADTLALIALNDALAAQTHAAGWLWVMVYAYALRLYFDFSGYTDIAIGVARVLGVRLPENFNQPYFKPNLTQFWNSWHMTLAQWFRAYYFNPLTRALRQRGWSPPPIILVGQVSTMLLIGLWHGITANFAIWGLWHGVGLFVHNRWAEFAKGRLSIDPSRTLVQRAVNAAGAVLTFHFVALGWVWFALSDPALSVRVLRGLFGG
ncbi:MAG: MBOAT family O-acyltransferase [Anaerolineae bacterium]|nr:hypothetical protein [Thermoflexales bacterium]MDW8396445.1 MBOAT family O-acyltransferase [Anaerolineae bacterium]